MYYVASLLDKTLGIICGILQLENSKNKFFE